MKPPAKQGRNRKFDNMECPRIGLAFRTRPTAPPKACAWDRDATASQNDPIRDERPRGANVEGRHLLCGFVGRLQLRSPDLPRKACPHRAADPFFSRTRVFKIDGGPKLKSGTPPPN